MQFKSVKSVVVYVNDFRATRGYSPISTVEWRRLSMKLSDCALIQLARRLASRLETEKPFLVGVDEQDFDPKVFVLDGNKFCILSLTKQIDEQTGKRTYTLGHTGQPLSGHLIDVSRQLTDADLAYALILIESKSLNIAHKERGRRSTGK